jgi:glutathione S-transferase
VGALKRGMILYSLANSPYSAAVRVAVYAKALDLRILPPPGGLGSDEYRALSGTGTVPCLMLEDGSPLPESHVILAYLDQKFPERPLSPPTLEDRARVALLIRLAIDGVMNPIVGMFHDLAAGAANAKTTALEKLTQGLAKLERFVGDAGFAAGPEFTLADCVLGVAAPGVGMFAAMLGAPDLVTRHPKLASYTERIVAHPAVAKVLAELQAEMPAELPG